MSLGPAIGEQVIQGARIIWRDGGDFLEDVREVREDVDVVPSGTLDDGVQGRGRAPTVLAAEEQVPFPPPGDRTQQTFDEIGVQWNSAIFEEPAEGLPTIHEVVDRLGQLRRRPQFRTHLQESSTHPLQEGGWLAASKR